MKIFNIYKFVITGLFLALLSLMTNNSLATAANTTIKSIDEELGQIEKKLIDIEKTISNLTIGINKLKENLSIFLIKKDTTFKITFLELLIRDKTWYKHSFKKDENDYLEKTDIGKMLTSLFWGKRKGLNSKLKVRCFYKYKDDRNKREYKVLKEFNISEKSKLSNLLSISVIKTGSRKRDKVDINISFW